MKNRIYLFCNQGFGNPFLQEFQNFASSQDKFDCIVVFSIKTSGKKGLKKTARFIRAYLENKYLIHFFDHFIFGGCMPLLVENVNRQKFVNSIPPGSRGFVAGFNQIFNKQIISRFSEFINFHPSILPFYRGAIPSYWVMKNNEPYTGFTAHKITQQIDCGEIIYQEILPVDQGITEIMLDQKISHTGAKYFKECLTAIAQDEMYTRKMVESPYKNNVGYTSSKRL